MKEYKKPKTLQEVRAVKSKIELQKITKAQSISEEVLEKALGFLKTDITEIEVASFINKEFKKRGVSILAFDTIVAFGKSTSDIHHEPNTNKLKKGDTIMFDFGCTVGGYCSDMTRTYFWGQPNKKQKEVYLSVLNAMDKSLSLLEKGERGCEVVDKVARDLLYKQYGKKSFPHTLGHGVGTAIHEWPHFRPNTKDMVPTGAVMTVEPAVYIKNWGGVRIEDMILVQKKGIKNLTKVPKNLENAILQVK